jgi:hypothetical protein
MDLSRDVPLLFSIITTRTPSCRGRKLEQREAASSSNLKIQVVGAQHAPGILYDELREKFARKTGQTWTPSFVLY